jgi:prostaglandin reductase 1
MQARKWTLKQRIEGMPKVEDFAIVTETLHTTLDDGEILAKAEWLTVDPYMRNVANVLPLGNTMPGGQVAKVIKSRHPQFPEGTKVVGNFGWRDLTLAKPGTPAEQGPATVYKMPNLRGLPDSYALGVCGMPGNTAYFGLTKLCQPKEGETLVVSAAAGAVGSVVGQVGKILGCKVVGFAGTDDKVAWLKKLGFDQAYNYKSVEIGETFQKNVKQGIDCYFDNVGGDFTYHTIRNMNNGGRIALCGAITIYNEDSSRPYLVPFDYAALIYKNIKMEGFMVLRFAKEWYDGISQLRDWIIEGKIQVQETVSEGFETMPQAFIDVLSGRNTGKQVIKA